MTTVNFNNWDYLADSQDDFTRAIQEATSPNERRFFENLRSKFLNEPAFSNDVLMHESDNEDGLFILRVGTDDILIGKNLSDPNEKTSPAEFAGIFMSLDQDLYPYIGRHLSLLQWLRNRDYAGINYDGNNDLK